MEVGREVWPIAFFTRSYTDLGVSAEEGFAEGIETPILAIVVFKGKSSLIRSDDGDAFFFCVLFFSPCAGFSVFCVFFYFLFFSMFVPWFLPILLLLFGCF